MLAITKTIPDIIQALINGTSFGGQGALVSSTANVTSAGWGTVKGTVGTGMVASRSWALASEQMQDARATGSWGPGRTVRMAGNVVMAAADTLALRLSGRYHFGTWSGQMADALRERTVDRQASRINAQAGASPGTISPGPPASQPPGAASKKP
jgi:type IV secretion system protein TrbL